MNIFKFFKKKEKPEQKEIIVPKEFLEEFLKLMDEKNISGKSLDQYIFWKFVAEKIIPSEYIKEGFIDTIVKKESEFNYKLILRKDTR